MDKYAEKMLKSLENPVQTGEYPDLKNNADLAMFLKQSVEKGILYTNVQDSKIVYFTAENYSQMHQNTAYELMYVLDGTVIKQIEDKKYTLHTGEGYILNRRITHSDDVQDGFLLVLDFSEEFFREVTRSIDIREDNHPVFSFIEKCGQDSSGWRKSYLEFSPTVPLPNEQFRTVLDSLQQELATKKIGASFLQKGLFLRLVELLENKKMFNINTIDIHSGKEDFLVERLTSYIVKKYGNVSRRDVEKDLNYNDEYLNRLLKKACGKTINRYAAEIRLDRARQLLSTTSLTIGEITNLLEFSSENYFYHFFKKAEGISPSRYRAEHHD